MRLRNTRKLLETANMGKSHLNMLEIFYKKLNESVGKRKAISIVYLDFDRIAHNILTFKLEKFGFDGWAVRHVRNSLDDHEL